MTPGSELNRKQRMVVTPELILDALTTGSGIGQTNATRRLYLQGAYDALVGDPAVDEVLSLILNAAGGDHK